MTQTLFGGGGSRRTTRATRASASARSRSKSRSCSRSRSGSRARAAAAASMGGGKRNRNRNRSHSRGRSGGKQGCKQVDNLHASGTPKFLYNTYKVAMGKYMHCTNIARKNAGEAPLDRQSVAQVATVAFGQAADTFASGPRRIKPRNASIARMLPGNLQTSRRAASATQGFELGRELPNMHVLSADAGTRRSATKRL